MTKKTPKRAPGSGESEKKAAPQPELPENTAAQPQDEEAPFPIVGVGASAGGFEAFSEILHGLPANPGMALVFVQHLDPKHVSVLSQLLGRGSKMPVTEAVNGMRVERDHVYVIPRNTSISIVKGVLQLGPREMLAGHFISIDTFLHSLAEDQGVRAIGVLLSGSASDGALGLQAIKAAGGITFAQDPRSAKFDSMPRSAIAAGSVDFILKPEEIARELLRLSQRAGLATAYSWESREMPPAASDDVLRILSIVREATGMDFSNYKATTIRRRILRRMALRRIDQVHNYLEFVRDNGAEVKALYEDILIHVTEFFRDPEAFEAMKKEILPAILHGKRRADEPLRIWVPGCSTGEEVYSVVISLLEFLGEKAGDTLIQVFATDISESALEKARAAVYPAGIKENVSDERLRRFFVRSNSGYQIQKRVRDLCILARHNLTRDPPFSKLDLISCRNVLIYLAPVLQERVIRMFTYALKPGGFLLLSPAESVGAHADMFQLVDKSSKIYRRTEDVSHLSLDFAVDAISEASEPAALARKSAGGPENDLEREADRVLLNRYAPPGVVVDDELNILQFRGAMSYFLEPVSGPASLSLLKMLKTGLVVEVKNAIVKVRRENIPVKREKVPFAADGHSEVNLEVIPFARRSGRQRKYIILFELVPPRPAARPPKGKRALEAQSRADQECIRLRQELAAAKEYLQSIIEDQEAAQEELRSASEEIQSSNEELQSTNEELETAKEELQSTNEELQSTNEELNTLNDELQVRNMQLAQVGDDLLNLLTNVNMPILILSEDLRIRRFTPVAERALHLIPSDVGRPIRDINLRIQLPNLEAMLREVTENLVPQVVEVSDEDGRTYSLRLRPYRTEDNKIDGVVMVFIDVDPVMRAADPYPSLAVAAPNSAPGRASLLMAQEMERRRLAHELHDELNQKLALLEFSVQNLATRNENIPEDVRQYLGEFRKSVSELSEDMRRVAHQLHPSLLDDLGLAAALESYCEEFSAREHIQVRLSHHSVPDDVAPMVGLVCYRVVQEALRNVAKHSGAKRAAVTLKQVNGRLELTIRDAGTGFQAHGAPHEGLGMLGMRERVALVGGTIQWKSKPGEGTEVTASIPLENVAKGAAGGSGTKGTEI